MAFGKVPDDWKNADVTDAFKEDKEVDPGNYSLLCFHSCHQKDYGASSSRNSVRMHEV